MASLHFLSLCFLILATSLEKLMGNKCVYEEDTEGFKCKLSEAGEQKAEQPKQCPAVTGSNIVGFRCKIVVIAEHGKSISIKWKNDNDIIEISLQSCSGNENSCSETRHTNTNSTAVNGSISWNIFHNSFTLNINKVQIAHQRDYTCRFYFEKGQGIMVIALKVVESCSDCHIAMQNGTVGCTTSEGHLSRQVQETSETHKSKCVSVENEGGSFSDISALARDSIYCCTPSNTTSSDTVCIASEMKAITSDNITKNCSIGIVLIILVFVTFLAVVLYRRKKKGAWPRGPIAYNKIGFPRGSFPIEVPQRTNPTENDV